MPDELTPTTFEPLIGAEFVIEIPDAGAVTVSLTSCERLPGGGRGPRHEPFSLVFSGPATPALPQTTYAFEHPALGRLEMFIVPIGPGPDGAPLYEAVFN